MANYQSMKTCYVKKSNVCSCICLYPWGSHCNTDIITVENRNDEPLVVLVNLTKNELGPEDMIILEVSNRNAVHAVLEKSSGDEVNMIMSEGPCFCRFYLCAFDTCELCTCELCACCD